VSVATFLRRKNAHRDSRAWTDMFQGHMAHGRRWVDPLILGITVALSLGGLIMVFSASGVVAEMKYGDSTYPAYHSRVDHRLHGEQHRYS